MTVLIVEFLGSTFAQRKAALCEADRFQALAEQALLDSVLLLRDIASLEPIDPDASQSAI